MQKIKTQWYKHKYGATSISQLKILRLCLWGFLVSYYLILNVFGIDISTIMGRNGPLFLWAIVAGLLYKCPRPKVHFGSKIKSKAIWWSVYILLGYIGVCIIGGLKEGFGVSPYSKSISGIVNNIISFGIVIVSKEMVRNFTINTVTGIKKRESLYLCGTALLMTILNIALRDITSLANSKEIVTYLIEELFPNFVSQLLVTYLVYYGGIKASLVYMIGLECFNKFSPLLPDLKWMTSAIIHILYPLCAVMALQWVMAKETGRRTKESKKDYIGWLVTTVISISMVWFSVGLFPIYPSVIVTGSMKPMIKPGDMVLYKKLSDADKQQLKQGDIVQFKRKDIWISHRIMDINISEDKRLFTTKGDNNSIEDPQVVMAEDIKGIYISMVPKIGIITLMLRSDEDLSLEDVEF